MDFQRYGVLVASKAEQITANKAVRNLPTPILWEMGTPEHMSELLWRISLPLMSFLLTLLAIPLGFVNPRRGRTTNLMIALLLAVSYSNAVGIVQSFVAQAKWTWAWSWWPLHLIGLIFIALLFAWRNNTNSRWHPVILLSMFKRLLFSSKLAAS
jgi:lipopolysaccharide export system permease protein